MSDPWLTFAPLQPHWVLPTDISLPYSLSEQVSIRPIPEWVGQPDTVDELRPQLREKLENDGSRHCIGVEYQVDAFGSPDPSWKGTLRGRCKTPQRSGFGLRTWRSGLLVRRPSPSIS